MHIRDPESPSFRRKGTGEQPRPGDRGPSPTKRLELFMVLYE